MASVPDGGPATARFSAATRAWFASAFPGGATPAQAGAWESIAAGENTLVVAPTGSGKTLAAFLWALDRLTAAPVPAERTRRCRVLYVSPLKALAADIERNLRAPLAGIEAAAADSGAEVPALTVGMRTGDTPAGQRRSFAVRPPDILITTPESLFLVLTSNARAGLAGVETVIVDEVHSVAGTKRGAHLAVSLERLDALLERPAQRIGLSATVRPVAEVAAFLGGPRPARVVHPPGTPALDLAVRVPVEDMARFGAGMTPERTDDRSAVARRSIWPHVEEKVLDLVERHASSIVFANSRRLAERLCARLNELAAQRAGQVLDTDSVPAELMGQADRGMGAGRVVARAHHGSVSKGERAAIEADLKAGRLRCVVATSSLELGIDMGAVDLVVQVESPPSVAGGLQRVGRAGHHVGEVSRGEFFPKFRGDLLATTVVVERMRAGAIEELRGPRNPLDVLAQQIVAMVAVEEWSVPGLAALVRRAAPFASLPDAVLASVLDMLSGRYPSDEFAELRPRVVWDREAQSLTGRPGAQRLAVTSGGTIPDRGTYAVHLPGGAGPSRVGELDEEMVYESRVGDVFVLGSSSWRIDEITADRVLVSPAPGRPGRLPFWKADPVGRPMELGRAIGALTRELSALPRPDAVRRAAGAGLDAWAADNLLDYLAEQREATGQAPDDRTVVVERFRDELGDWRVVLHSPLGGRVHAPWAMVIGARLRARFGMDAQVVHGDDGIVLRLPDAGDEDGPASLAELFAIDPDEVERAVTEQVGGSALFAARFRECAARALLLPRRRPDRRMPLWQQRQRSAQLLAVAGRFGSFPITLEAVRECLRDVFDVPGLRSLMADVEARRVRFVEVRTERASAFAQSLMMGYTAAFLYEDDVPLAEARAQALTLDSALLAELLGETDVRDLLDPGVVAEEEARLQRLAPGTGVRPDHGVEDTADLLRELGPLSVEEAGLRGARPEWLAELGRRRRAVEVVVGGGSRWAAAADAARLRDALGAALPDWLGAGGGSGAGDGSGTGFASAAEAFAAPVDDPLGDLLSRFARTHGPFGTGDAAARFGLGPAVVAGVLGRFAAQGRLVRLGSGDDVSGAWCDAEVLRVLRRRSISRLRKEVEPVAQEALARFVPAWQQAGGEPLRGPDAVFAAVESLRGAPVPASALEPLVLGARVADYEPALLDALTTSGEVVWAGAGTLAGNDGWVCLAPAGEAALVLPEPSPVPDSPAHRAVLDALDDGGALFFRGVADRVARAVGAGAASDQEVVAVLWDLVWAGLVGNDSLAPLRALLGAGGTAHRSRRRGPVLPSRTGPPTGGGRWWRLPERDADPTRRAHAGVAALLDRYGVVTRGPVAAEQDRVRSGRDSAKGAGRGGGPQGGFSAVYPVLRAFEESGRARRGYFVEGLGAAQFALPGAVDRLRAVRRADPGPVVLAAADPANVYGAALAWPPSAAGLRPGRKAGALVVLDEGALVLYVERGGRSVLTFGASAESLARSVTALAERVRAGAVGALAVERCDGAPVFGGALADALLASGFHPTPKALRLRR
ncbi:ATP-dependent Lhr-like helicase [Murinocardiopsis flavida]|uniref:ATP-dependent Lhr-like helicase n=1 Tax=Murinocardiopsis flavida TaxID=645275 RepID=A0A2P8DUS7_9ACTN|nr:ATP-dependent helicase [Murinocardiopsis flavida]PSL00993.1 ATP-dependent Lhr-like helicase [Murinocardiopsis flavida]